MLINANHRIKERCMICEGRGKHPSSDACGYCAGTGFVFARTGLPKEILQTTGDCKIPVKKRQLDGVSVTRRFT